MPAGQPTKFNKVDKEQIKQLYLAGWTDKQVANFFKIKEQTITNWKKAHPEFFASLKDWKKEADEKVERSLYERANGYEHASEEIFCVGGNIIRATTVKKYAPSEVACIFWLKNRQPNKWRDKQEEKETDARLNDEVDFVGVPTNDGDRFKRFTN